MANAINPIPATRITAPPTPRAPLAPAVPPASDPARLVREAGQVGAAAETVRSGPQASPESEALWAGMKLAMARQNAQDEARFNGEGETRKPNGDVSTVTGFNPPSPVLRHSVKSPDGSSRESEVTAQWTRLTETAPDGTATVYYADSTGTVTVEHRDASGQPISTDVYIYGEDGVEHQRVSGRWEQPEDPNRNIGPPGMA